MLSHPYARRKNDLVNVRSSLVGPAAPVSAGGPARARAALAWIGARVTTTPGRLVVISAAVVVGALVFGIVAFTAERSREAAAQAVASQTEPLLLEANGLYASLSDAEATVTTSFVRPGLEPSDRRTRYLNDLQAAGSSLAALSRESGSSRAARRAVEAITTGLPIYSGLVEAARADRRQGLPLGAAYLRRASEVLTTTILPAADRLYETQAARLNVDYRTGTATSATVAYGLVGVVAVGLLLLAARYLTRVSRRVLNVPLLGAATALMGLVGWGLVGLLTEQSALAGAQARGSDAVEVLSATRILASRAQSDESLALVSRGGDAQPAADFDAIMRALGDGGRGLISEVASQARATGSTRAATDLANELAVYRTGHAKIAALAAGPRFLDAIDFEAASAAAGDSPYDRLNSNLLGQIRAAQDRFVSRTGDATSALSGLAVAIPVLTVLAAVLALVGLRARINEYR